jgi:hypothetical protein
MENLGRSGPEAEDQVGYHMVGHNGKVMILGMCQSLGYVLGSVVDLRQMQWDVEEFVVWSEEVVYAVSTRPAGLGKSTAMFSSTLSKLWNLEPLQGRSSAQFFSPLGRCCIL